MEKTHNATILIVEDESVFRLIYRGVLEKEGYQVLEAENGLTAWDLVKKKKPDLVLLDLILPELSGYEVLKKIRTNEETKEIPVIIFSVLGAGEDIQKALDLGANYYRVKGSNSPSEILNYINKLLDKN